MYADVSNFLDIDETSDLSGQLIAISESKADGTFLIHHFLSLFLHRDRRVHFIGLLQSFGHYNAVSQKCGLSLNKLRECGKLDFVEGLRAIGGSIISEPSGKHEDNQSKTTEKFNKWPDSVTHHQSLRELFLYVRDLIEKATGTGDCGSPVILIDDLTVLLCLGVPLKEMFAFIHYMKSEFVYKRKGTVVLFASGDTDVGDDDQEVMWRFLCHISSLQLRVTGLPSGYLRDVQGEIAMIRKQPSVSDSSSVVKVKPAKLKKTQFRVTERKVSCFAIGTSSVVL